jgi:competence protein ComEA
MTRPALYRLVVVALLLALLGAGLALLALRAAGPSDSLEILLPTPTPQPQALVYVTGAVGREGLYSLREGDRAADVIALAGGLAADADRARVNLAARVADGDHIHVPWAGDASPPPEAQPPARQTINVNTASAAELERLPGIGPVRAAAIVAWRERNGAFRRIEDLLAVEGIGPATLERLRPSISVR